MQRTLAALAEIADREGRELYIVGGFVRDALRGIESRDVDIVVDTDAEQFAKRASWFLRGSYELLDSQAQYSRVSLFAADGLPFSLDFSLRRGKHVTDDLCCRDFTVNAMAVSLKDYLSGEGWQGKVLDPCGGRQDLADKLLRLTAEECLRDDPVRLLRTARFLIKLGFSLESATREMIRQNAARIRKAAKVKLAIEFFQLLAQRGTALGIRVLHEDLDVLKSLFPPVGRMCQVLQNGEDLFNHGLLTCESLENMLDGEIALTPQAKDRLMRHLNSRVSEQRPRLAYLKLACIFHDIGRIDQPVDRDNLPLSHFSHGMAAEVYVESLAARLKLACSETNYLSRLICCHSRPLYILEEGAGRLRFMRQFQDCAAELLLLALADLAARGEKTGRRTEMLIRLLEEYLCSARGEMPEPVVTAQEIMDFFNLPPTRAIGELLEQVYAMQLAGKVKTRSQALALVSQLLDNKSL